MRHRKALALFLALSMLAALAGPASANAIGVFTGTVQAGKAATYCDHHGNSDAGRGSFPGDFTGPTAYEIDTRDDLLIGSGNFGPGSITMITTPDKGKGDVSTGHLQACGRLDPGSDRIGTACMAKGYHGKGKITFTDGPQAGQDYYLQHITWKPSEAGTMILWANGRQGEPAEKDTEGPDLVLGEIQTQYGPLCWQHRDQVLIFTVVGALEIVNDAWVDPQEGAPVVCKETDDPICAYDDKKDPLPKDD